MEIAIVIAAVVFWFFWSQSRKTININKLCLATFPVWLTAYIRTSNLLDKATMAKSLIIQSLNLATEMEGISREDSKMLLEKMKREDPGAHIQIMDEWIESTLPTLTEVAGEELLDTSQARLIGALMVVSLVSVNPRSGLLNFLQTKGFPKDLTRMTSKS